MGAYLRFTRQTDYVVQYLSIARKFEHHTRVEVPKLKHAPVNLGRQLEEYLKDPDFEIHRRQYLAELEAKKSKGGSGGASSRLFNKTDSASRSGAAKASSSANGSSQQASKPAAKSAAPAKGPDHDLIDFFDSIEQNQTPMPVQPQVPAQTGMTPWGNSPFQMGQVQTNGFVPQQQTGFASNTPFQQQQQPAPQLQTNFTGAGFGGFTPQPAFQPSSLAPIPQDTVASFQTGAPSSFQNLQTGQQTTNPFRQSMLMTGQANSPFTPTTPTSAPQQQQQRPLTSQSTNPFARSSPQADQPFATPNSPFQSQSPQQAAPLQPMQTGTNPFARNFGAAQPQQQQQQQQQRPVTAGALAPQPTGTNPFRQSAFVNHATGMGWQNNQQPMGGGLDQLETVPVFPRPAQQTPWQQ